MTNDKQQDDINTTELTNIFPGSEVLPTKVEELTEDHFDQIADYCGQSVNEYESIPTISIDNGKRETVGTFCYKDDETGDFKSIGKDLKDFTILLAARRLQGKKNEDNVDKDKWSSEYIITSKERNPIVKIFYRFEDKTEEDFEGTVWEAKGKYNVSELYMLYIWYKEKIWKLKLPGFNYAPVQNKLSRKIGAKDAIMFHKLVATLKDKDQFDNFIISFIKDEPVKDKKEMFDKYKELVEKLQLNKSKKEDSKIPEKREEPDFLKT